jgi:hypothetical protein
MKNPMPINMATSTAGLPAGFRQYTTTQASVSSR